VKRQVTPWQVLKQRDFGLFWTSLLFSAVGSQISTVAVAWQVYEITNSPFQLGLTGLFRALPVMILSIPGGVVADRMDRRRLLIITQALAMLLSLVLGLLTSTAQIRVWHIYAVTFLSGAVDIFDAPARTALIPLLVPAEQLASAYALNISWRQIATLAGPFLGGIVISAFGISTSYYVDALSFLSVIVCLFFMRARPSPPAEKKESPLQSVRGGFNFIRENAAILGLMSMDTCVNFFGAYRSMMPAFARDILGTGPAGLGQTHHLGHPALHRRPRLLCSVPFPGSLSCNCLFFGTRGRYRRELERCSSSAHDAGPHARAGEEFRPGLHVCRHIYGSPSDGNGGNLLRGSRRHDLRWMSWFGGSAFGRQICAQSKKHRRLRKRQR